MNHLYRVLVLLCAFCCMSFQATHPIFKKSDSLYEKGKVTESNELLYSILKDSTTTEKLEYEAKFKIVENYLLVNQLDSVQKYLIELKSEIKDEYLMTRYYHSRGIMLFQANNNVEAMKNFVVSQNNALKLKQERMITLNNLYIGRLLYVSRDYENMKKYLNMAIQSAEESGYNDVIFLASGMLADHYMNEGEFVESEKKLKVLDSIKESDIEKFTYHAIMGKYAYYKNEMDKVMYHAMEAMKYDVGLAIFKSLENSFQIDPPKGEDYLASLNNLLDSVENINSQFLKSIENNDFVKDVYFDARTKSTLLTEKNYLDEIEDLKKIIALKDSAYNVKKEKAFLDLERKYRAEEKEKENLTLQKENAIQELNIERERKQKWLLATGLFALILILLIFFYFYRRNQKQKKMITHLQRELHHNIKNNLAIVDAFLEETKDQIKSDDVQLKLSELQNRIESIGQVHKQLYITKNVLNLHTGMYLQKLSKNVSSLFPQKEVAVEIKIQKDFQLPIEKIFPVGLIVNEFLTNSYKYAFKKDQKGQILIDLKDQNNLCVLSLSDNGVGLPKDFDMEKLDSFGMEVMKILSQQLEGSFALSSENGVQLEIKFEKDKK